MTGHLYLRALRQETDPSPAALGTSVDIFRATDVRSRKASRNAPCGADRRMKADGAEHDTGNAMEHAAAGDTGNCAHDMQREMPEHFICRALVHVLPQDAATL